MDKSALRGFPKVRSTILGGPYNKDYGILGLYWGTPIWGSYHDCGSPDPTESHPKPLNP